MLRFLMKFPNFQCGLAESHGNCEVGKEDKKRQVSCVNNYAICTKPFFLHRIKFPCGENCLIVCWSNQFHYTWISVGYHWFVCVLCDYACTQPKFRLVISILFLFVKNYFIPVSSPLFTDWLKYLKNPSKLISEFHISLHREKQAQKHVPKKWNHLHNGTIFLILKTKNIHPICSVPIFL